MDNPKDCPRGLARIKDFSSRARHVIAAATAALLTGSPAIAQDNGNRPITTDKPRLTRHLTGKICPPSHAAQSNEGGKIDSARQNQSQIPAQPQASAPAAQDNYNSKVHFSAFNLYKEGQQLERSGAFAKAVDVYQKALRTMSKQKHDSRFHLKIETALSRVKAKAGINQ